jgi:DNA processing protein
VRTSSRLPDDDARLRALAFALAPGVGPRRWIERVERFGSAERAFDATLTTGERDRARGLAERALADAVRVGARVLLLGDESYPAALRDLHDPPPVLFAIGDLSLVRRTVVAVVGTRSATPYGVRVTQRLASVLARAGACIASGMARGVDAVAHEAALDARAPTIAVLGTGVDVAYPVAHRALHARIAREGLLLSELPCGTRAVPGSFPRRNRVIAALARLTLVTEAGRSSGALITADHASELGRDVAAVPGPIDVPQCAGSNRLLRDGAHVVAEEAWLLTLAGLREERRVVVRAADDAERRVLEALGEEALDLETLVERSGLPAREAMVALTALELSGGIEALADGRHRVAHLPATERRLPAREAAD